MVQEDSDDCRATSVRSSHRSLSLLSKSTSSSHAPTETASTLTSDSKSSHSKTGKNGVKGLLSAFRFFGKKSKSMSELKNEVRESPLPSPKQYPRPTTPPQCSKPPGYPQTPKSPQSIPHRLKPSKSEPVLNCLSTPSSSLPSSASASSTSSTSAPTTITATSSSSSSSKSFPTCSRLLDIGPNGSLYLRREALECLRAVDSQVIILAAVGGAGVGKSSLLNKVGRNQAQFMVGDGDGSNRRKTPGVSMAILDPWWDTQAAEKGHLKHRDESGNSRQKRPEKVVLLDTPSLDGSDEANEWESKLMTLVVLASSCLVIVGRERFDDAALSALRTFGDLPRLIDPATRLDTLSSCLPRVFWALLDSDAPNTDRDPDFLDSILNPPPQPYINETAEMARAVLAKLFTNQSLHSVPMPSSLAENCDKASPTDEAIPRRPRSNAFRRRMERLIRALGEHADVKKIWGPEDDSPAISLRGKDLANLLVACCDTLNNHRLLDLGSIWEQISDARWKTFCRAARAKYEDLMTALAVPDMPLDLESLRKRHGECSRKTILGFRDGLDGDLKGRALRRKESQLMRIIGEMDERGRVEPPDGLLASFVAKNYDAAMAKCRSVLVKGQADITKKIAEEHFTTIPQFDAQVQRIINNFHRSCRAPTIISEQASNALLTSFTTKIDMQRTGLVQHLQERAHLIAEREVKHHIIRVERDRREREAAVARAVEELRGVQEAVGEIRFRAIREEARLREEEKEVRRRLMAAVVGTDYVAGMNSGISAPMASVASNGSGGIGGLVGIPGASSSHRNRGRSRARGGWTGEPLIDLAGNHTGSNKCRSTSAGRYNSSKSDNGDWYSRNHGMHSQNVPPVPPLPPIPTQPPLYYGADQMAAFNGHSRSRSGPAPGYGPVMYGYGGYSDMYGGR